MTHAEKVFAINQLRQIIELTMNSKNNHWTIQSRERTLNKMWYLVRQYEKNWETDDDLS